MDDAKTNFPMVGLWHNYVLKSRRNAVVVLKVQEGLGWSSHRCRSWW